MLNYKFYIVWGLLMLPTFGAISAQPPLTKESIGLKSGVFSRRAVKFFDAGDNGHDCVWDFSNLEVSDEEQTVRQNLDSLGRIVVTDNKEIKYFITRGDSLLLTGDETPMIDISYSFPILRMKYPMALNDSVSKKFEGYGVYCGDHFYKQSGVISIVVDGFGDILLSKNDTLKNALRVYKLKSYSIAMDMDPSKIDSAKLKQVVEETYEWYIDGIERPVLESITSTSYSNMNPLGTTRYAYCNLTDDEVLNKKKASQNNSKDNNKLSSSDSQYNIIDYDVDIKDSSIGVTYNLSSKANITILLSNALGMIFEQKRFVQNAGSNYHVNFDISRLIPDVYILYINVNGKIYNEKFNKR